MRASPAGRFCRAIALLGVWWPGAAAALPAPVLELTSPPQLDGRLDAREGWAAAPLIELAGSAGERPVAQLVRTDRELVVGLRIPGAELPPLRRAVPVGERDALSLADDAIELWYATADELWRVVVNARGAVWDAVYRPVAATSGSWEVDRARRLGVRSASRLDAGVWTAEVALPLGAGSPASLSLAVHRRRPDRSFGWPEVSEPGTASAERAELRAATAVSAAGPRPPRVPPACPAGWPAAGRGAAFRVAYYPYASKLRIHLDAAAVPGIEAFERASLRVTPEAGGDPVLEASWRPVTAGVDEVRSLPDLADGSYRAALSFSGAPDCEPLAGPVRRFEHRSFGWEHNELGRGDAVIPPFVPLVVAGREVTAVGRRYHFDALGLFAAVESLGEPLLAGPARWVVEVDGQLRTPEPSRAARLRSVAPGRVELEAAWSAGPLRARLRGEIELDGLVLLDLELSAPAGATVERLELVVPLRAEQATLFNAISDGARHHRLERLPQAGGLVWDSLQVGRRFLPPEFVPYVWIGTERRGLAWFAESTRGWSVAPGRPTQQIHRRGDEVLWSVRFFGRPARVKEARRIRFAFQATPTKPRPETPRPWRFWQLECRTQLPVFRVCPLASGTYWGTPTPYGNLRARDGALALLAAARRSGREDTGAVDRWLAAQTLESPARRKILRDHLLWSMRGLAARPGAVIAYVNPHGAAWGPEFEVYSDVWRTAPFGDRNGADANENQEIKTRASESWNDYFLWHLAQLLDSGAIDGFFFDNTFLRASFDDVSGPGFRDEEGVLRPGVDLFALRDLLRRAQRLVYERRGAWLNLAHMTTTPMAPVQGWAGISLGGEWKYGRDDFQERFSRDYLRAAALGSQTGTLSVFLPGIRGTQSPSEKQRVERSMAGVTALHEIRVMKRMTGALESVWAALLDHGYGRPDALVKRYWDADRGFALEGADAEALVVAHAGRALALVVSFGEPAEVVLRLDPSVLGVERGGVCADVERRAPEAGIQPAGCRFQLARHDFRLIEYAPGRP